MDLDVSVRTEVYRHIVQTSAAPRVEDIVMRLGLGAAEVRAAYQRLYNRRVLVVAEDGETILMAPPFSGVPTQHRVTVGAATYFANCSWDALGIPAALKAEAVVRSRCEQSHEPIVIRVGLDGPDSVPCVIHFAVPAAAWWDDIVYT
jgi:hypothetical protein